MLTFEVNWLAVILGTFLNMGLGALWYGPLFGKPWMEAVGLSLDDIKNNPSKLPYPMAIFNSFIMAFMLANVIIWADVSSLGGGMLMGVFMWIGFTGFSFGVNHAFELRSPFVWLINSGMYLVGLIIMGAVLSLWK